MSSEAVQGHNWVAGWTEGLGVRVVEGVVNRLLLITGPGLCMVAPLRPSPVQHAHTCLDTTCFTPSATRLYYQLFVGSAVPVSQYNDSSSCKARNGTENIILLFYQNEN